MPLYRFECSKCKAGYSMILEPAERNKQVCQVDVCRGKLRRVVKALSNQVIETLDNGLMPRKLERFSDAQRIFTDHAKSDPRKNP